MRTDHVTYDLVDYITHRLSAEEYKRVELHLLDCTECNNHFLGLLATETMLKQNQSTVPSPVYYATILPRVRERLDSRTRRFWVSRDHAAKIILPLAVSIFLLVLLTRISTNSISEPAQIEALHQAVIDLNEEEVVMAVEKEYIGFSVFPVQEAAAAGVAEHLQGNRFLTSAISHQIENEEVAEMDIEGMISDLNREQVDQVISDLTERNVL